MACSQKRNHVSLQLCQRWLLFLQPKILEIKIKINTRNFERFNFEKGTNSTAFPGNVSRKFWHYWNSEKRSTQSKIREISQSITLRKYQKQISFHFKRQWICTLNPNEKSVKLFNSLKLVGILEGRSAGEGGGQFGGLATDLLFARPCIFLKYRKWVSLPNTRMLLSLTYFYLKVMLIPGPSQLNSKFNLKKLCILILWVKPRSSPVSSDTYSMNFFLNHMHLLILHHHSRLNLILV